MGENRSSGFPTRPDTNRAVQPHKMVSGLKFWVKQVEELYYLCSENKGADQLCGYYREADLRLCLHICKEPVFSGRGSNMKDKSTVKQWSIINFHVARFFKNVFIKAKNFFQKVENISIPKNTFQSIKYMIIVLVFTFTMKKIHSSQPYILFIYFSCKFQFSFHFHRKLKFMDAYKVASKLQIHLLKHTKCNASVSL